MKKKWLAFKSNEVVRFIFTTFFYTLIFFILLYLYSYSGVGGGGFIYNGF
ncbi:MAG: teichoic acid D-Ala incorporation-associated protein DltX [Bombilactobacillus mellifer]|nr:teichoic acid D-Ala incorporation-associated protein DltX [Bombilactobacillus mellifer]